MNECFFGFSSSITPPSNHFSLLTPQKKMPRKPRRSQTNDADATKAVPLNGENGITIESAVPSINVQRYKDSRRRLSHQSGQHNTITTGSSGLFVGPEDVDALQDDQANVQDLDEPTLGQRLRGIRSNAATSSKGVGSSFNGNTNTLDDDDDDDDEQDEDEDGEGNPFKRVPLPEGSLSLGETLTQALHSNDSAMLSGCLAHSDPNVIRLSVVRLSGPLAVRLLEHCIELMARGGKKSVGQLSSARARGIIEWVRATLTAHTAYLMSLPNLVQRLAQLHSTLTSRLASQERLLALNGRLELVLSQIELRNAYNQQKQARGIGGGRKRGKKGTKSQKQNGVKQWVEGSSEEEEEEEENEGMDVDEEADIPIQAPEEGVIQDIALGGAGAHRKASKVKRVEAESESESDAEDEEEDEEDEDDEEDVEEDEDDEDEEDGENDENGLLDLEAEESSDDGSYDSEEEEDDEDEDE